MTPSGPRTAQAPAPPIVDFGQSVPWPAAIRESSGRILLCRASFSSSAGRCNAANSWGLMARLKRPLRRVLRAHEHIRGRGALDIAPREGRRQTVTMRVTSSLFVAALVRRVSDLGAE